MTREHFGAHLRHERERRGMTLSSVAERTKIAPPLLVALERGDLTRLPGGLYRRSFVRAYAEAVGLDPDEVARDLVECCPDAAPVPAALDAAAQPSPAAARPASTAGGVRLRIDPAPDLCRGGPILSEARHRVGAIAADLGILGLISMGFWMAVGDVWMPLAVAMAVYYAGGILILGNTPGVCLSAAVARDDSARTEANHASHA